MIFLLRKLGKFYWNIKDELSVWKFFVLRIIPGQIGIRLRQIFLSKTFMSCGDKPRILEGFIIDNPEGLSIGDNFICNRCCHINAGGIVRIGNNVMLGPGVKIWSVNHRFDDLSIPVIKQGYDYAEVNIEDDVWIGSSVFVAPGVNIGTRSVIGAGSVLTKSVAPFSLVVGNPGKVIRQLGTYKN
jgi:acetyltransferase-like isoleucine patch superfamily enzyme